MRVPFERLKLYLLSYIQTAKIDFPGPCLRDSAEDEVIPEFMQGIS